MTTLRCRICGGDLTVLPGARIARCEYCGTKQLITPEGVSDAPQSAPTGLHLLPDYVSGKRIDRALSVDGARVRITEPLAEGECVRYYFCDPPEGGTALLAVAASKELNDVLEQTEQTLAKLAAAAERYERENAQRGGKPLSYDRLFPRVGHAAVSPEQGGRRVHTLLLPPGTGLPLAVITENGDRVDLKTGAWIMGRMLKLLGFAHAVGMTVPVEEAGILIDPDRHGLAFYDWTRARSWPEGVPPEREAAAVAAAAGLCLKLTGEPDDCTPGERDYLALLRDMAALRYDSAMAAHRDFYTIIRQIWGIAFHPFTIQQR